MSCSLTEPSDVPENITLSAQSATSVLVAWQPPAVDARNGIIVGYTVGVVGVQTSEEFDRSTNETEILITGLHPFYAYRFTVAARTVGLGPYSTSLQLSLPGGG